MKKMKTKYIQPETIILDVWMELAMRAGSFQGDYAESKQYNGNFTEEADPNTMIEAGSPWDE